jgi:hypothetical protein
VVSSLGSDLTGFHHFVSGNSNGVFEAVHVPSLKEGEVQTDVRWVEGFFMRDLYEEASEVFDVVHFLLSVFGYRLSVFCSRFSVDCLRFVLVEEFVNVGGFIKDNATYSGVDQCAVNAEVLECAG